MFHSLKKQLLSKNCILYTIIYSGLIFSTISFISVLFSLFIRKGTANPELHIGFPLAFYNQFWIKNYDLHWGWHLKAFIIDFILVWVFVSLIYCLKDSNTNHT